MKIGKRFSFGTVLGAGLISLVFIALLLASVINFQQSKLNDYTFLKFAVEKVKSDLDDFRSKLISNNSSDTIITNEFKEEILKTLTTLHSGGELVIGESSFKIKRVTDPEILFYLNEVKNSWSHNIINSQAILLNESQSEAINRIDTIYSLLSKLRFAIDDEHDKEINLELIIWASLIFVSAVLLLINYLVFIHYYKIPIKKISSLSSRIAEGDLSETLDQINNKELNQIAISLNSLICNQHKIVEYAESIGDGKFNAQLEMLSEKDRLSSSLISMCTKLEALSNNEKKRNWANEGYAKFSDILRKEVDTKTLCDTLLSNLIKYVNANQGAVFLLEEDESSESYLEQAATFAWGRKKFFETKIKPGDGLIGQALLDADTIFLTKVPDNFIQITSGLGEANPTCVVLVPMKSNEKVHGVLELAFFRVLDTYEIEFIEKLCESFASTISSAKVNEKTKKLLDDSRRLTEEMRSQEEELRQNMEELQATQEEMSRKEMEMRGIFSSLNYSLATIECDLNGKIIGANDKFLSLLNYSLNEIIEKPFYFFIKNLHDNKNKLDDIFTALRSATPGAEDCEVTDKAGNVVWFSFTFTPVTGVDSIPYKIIILGQNITEKKLAEIASRELSVEAMKQAEELRNKEEVLMLNMKELEAVKASLSVKLEEARNEMRGQIKTIEMERAKCTAILEGAVDGVITFRHDGVIEFFNMAAEEIFAVDKSKVLGSNIKNILSIELKENHPYYVKDDIAKEVGIRTEVNVERSDGTIHPVLISISKSNLGEKSYYTLFIQSIAVELF